MGGEPLDQRQLRVLCGAIDCDQTVIRDEVVPFEFKGKIGDEI